MSDLIKGKVAAILNSRELVINKGDEDGVKDGMKFKILDRIAEIFDPDTKKILGRVQREKIRVKIVEVKEKLSIGRTYETYEENVGGRALDIANIMAPSRYITKVRTLASSDSNSGVDYGPLGEVNSIVKVGDDVLELLDDF